MAGGVVICNRQDSDEDEDDHTEEDRILEEIKKEEEEETLSILIDSRLLHKDFISNNFTRALFFYQKVRHTAVIR